VAVFVEGGVHWRKTDEGGLLSLNHGEPNDGENLYCDCDASKNVCEQVDGKYDMIMTSD
jgi:hypothetical protein